MNQPDTNAILQKPPLGIMPRKISDKVRIMEVLGAIRRYANSGLMFPQEWLDEVVDYVERQ